MSDKSNAKGSGQNPPPPPPKPAPYIPVTTPPGKEAKTFGYTPKPKK